MALSPLRALRPTTNKLKLLLGRAIVRLIDDSAKLQTVQVEALRGEVLDGIERFQQYGFTAHPHANAEAIVLSFGGIRQHSIVIAVDDFRHRLTDLEEGEVALYTDLDSDAGQRIVLKRDGSIEILSSDSSVAIADGNITLNANAVHITSRSLTHNGTNIGDTHRHGGVTPGRGSTSGPG